MVLMPGGCLQVKTYAVNNSSGHTFYVMAADGSAPDREKVKQACSDIGGKLVDPGACAMLCLDKCQLETLAGMMAPSAQLMEVFFLGKQL